jgi:hypothetical protein
MRHYRFRHIDEKPGSNNNTMFVSAPSQDVATREFLAMCGEHMIDLVTIVEVDANDNPVTSGGNNDCT